MGTTKAPRSDGLPTLLSETLAVVKSICMCVVRDFLAGKECPEDFNDTILVLNSKVNSLKLLTQFCPISLYNVLYKIAYKVVVNRLREILPILISE
jgi:hypothetical protein